MKKALLFLSFILIVLSCRQSENKISAKLAIKPVDIQEINNGNIEFSKYFLDKTMRFDYFHSGTSTEEHFATDRVVSDGIWSGSKKILIDELRLGLYFFEVIDKESNVLLYSRGFASIFGNGRRSRKQEKNGVLFTNH
jgi:hypothetical protein